MQRQESTPCNSSATYFPSSLPSAKERRQKAGFFPRRHLFVTKEVEDIQLCSVPQQL